MLVSRDTLVCQFWVTPARICPGHKISPPPFQKNPLAIPAMPAMRAGQPARVSFPLSLLVQFFFFFYMVSSDSIQWYLDQKSYAFYFCFMIQFLFYIHMFPE